MGHYAKINQDNIVEQVIVANQEFINSGAVGDASQWIQTSYNTRGGVHYKPDSNEPSGQPGLRKNYAGIGYIYDKKRDAFYSPSPFPSWVLDEDTCHWQAPIPLPSDSGEVVDGILRIYNWNEEDKKWDLIKLDPPSTPETVS
jgi:hypothetical protein